LHILNNIFSDPETIATVPSLTISSLLKLLSTISLRCRTSSILADDVEYNDNPQVMSHGQVTVACVFRLCTMILNFRVYEDQKDFIHQKECMEIMFKFAEEVRLALGVLSAVKVSFPKEKRWDDSPYQDEKLIEQISLNPDSIARQLYELAENLLENFNDNHAETPTSSSNKTSMRGGFV